MATTTFINQQTIIQADWLNDVNNMTYVTGPALNTSVASLNSTKANAGANTDITSLSTVTVPTQANGTSNTTIANMQALSNAIANYVPPATKQIQNISAVATSNTMVVSINPTVLDFRSSTLSSGVVTPITLGATSNLTIPQGATLGAANSNLTRIAVGGAVNNGTIVPIVGGANVNLDESVLINVTNISNAANSSNVFYSNVNLTSVPWRSVGFIDSNQSAAGTYATQPALVQGVGGNALIGLARQVISTPVATTSGTSVSLTGIPSHTKTFTLNLNGVSTNGTSSFRIQIGAGSAETSGYLGSSSAINGAGAASCSTFSSGFDFLDVGSAASIRQGSITFTLVGSNTWAISGNISYSDASRVMSISGTKTVSGMLDRVVLTTVGGADTFDAGSANFVATGF